MRIPAEHLLALSSLLDEAMDLPEAAREQWLQDLPEPFPGAREMLRKMLKGDASGEGENRLDTLLKVPLSESAFGAATDTGPFKPNAQIGNYRLERLLGTGGMGAVWLARRTDELVNRLVALKLPHLHLQSAIFAERFARERDILANLTHPNIAHLYDAGVSPEGQPYLAMEYVSGESLTQYCASHGLTIEQRLDRFLQVLSAVHYAHAQHIIHRDLKPSNILVREGGQVVLLDFGIAKLLVEGETAETALTRHGGAALTPDYASPEQISGEPLGAASDIYSLGVVLYELLAGQRPYELKQTTRRALEQAILTSDPRPPSEMVTGETTTKEATSASHRVRRALQGDLDTIVLKALKKQPEERYSTASEFADDLRRYLRGEAVSARPDSLGYRAKKWTRRHKPVLQGVGITAVVIAALFVGTNALWRKSDQTIALAPVPAPFSPPPHSIAVLPFVNMSGDASQDYFSDGISEELLDSLSRLNGLQVAARTSSFSFKGQQIDAATIARKLNVGALLEGSVRRAGNTVRISAKLINTVTGFQLWSQTYDRSLTDVLKVQSDVATSVARQLETTLGADEAAKMNVGGTTNTEAYDEYLQGMQHLEAPNEDAQELEHFDRAVKLDPNFAAAYAERGLALSVLANTSQNLTNRETLRLQAITSAERAVALAPDFGEAHGVLATVRRQQLDLAGAAREYRRALELAPGSAQVQRTYAYLAAFLGHFAEAIAAAQRAVRLDPQGYSSRRTQALVFAAARRFSDALVALKAAAILHPGSVEVEEIMNYVLLASNQFDELLKRCKSPTTTLEDQDRYQCLALAYHALGRQADAQREFNKVQFRDSDASDNASFFAQWGDKAAALAWLAKAEQLRDAGLQSLKVDYQLDPIREEPQFKAILARMNFPPDADLEGLSPSDRKAPIDGAPTRRAQSDSLPTTINPKSVAVLPFVDMSEKRDQEYFSDGMSEELIDNLAHTPDLMVIARTSSFQFRGGNDDVKTIGQKLGVANLLEGSVRRSGETLRVTAQLIKVSNGSHLWSQIYDRKMGDIFKVQDEIASAVATALQAAMTVTGVSSGDRSENLDAYDALLRGRYFFNRFTKQDSEQAITEFKEAIKLDPVYAAAWVGLGRAYNTRGIFGWMQPKEAYAKARSAVDKALSIDPNLAIGHSLLSALEWNYLFDPDASRAEMHIARTLSLPVVELANSDGGNAMTEGRFDDAIHIFRDGIRRDPLNTVVWEDLQVALYGAGRLAEAESAARSMLQLNPSRDGAHCELGEILRAENKLDAAMTAMSEEPDTNTRMTCMTDLLWSMGRRAESDALLEKLKAKLANSQAISIAESYALRNDKDNAFKWLDRAYENRESGVMMINAVGELKVLHNDPRYTALLRKLKQIK